MPPLPELRKDPLSATWVIIAAERGKRPHDFTPSADADRPRPKHLETCSFCTGNEAKTPPEILAYRPVGNPNGPGWRIRVVPNKFPALEPGGSPDGPTAGLYRRMAGVGAHEVVIESPDHSASLADYLAGHLAEVWHAIWERHQDLRRDPRLKYVQVFKNVGATAGASLEHPHFQIVATPLVPAAVQEELTMADRYWEATGRCVFCDLMREERAAAERLVAESDRFLAFCPYAARMPYETWILPRSHQPDFGSLSQAEGSDLAAILRSVAGRLENSFRSPPYNLILHTTPLAGGHERSYHWHLELLPRLTVVAGFEWGTGYYINPTAPELAAQILREEVRPH